MKSLSFLFRGHFLPCIPCRARHYEASGNPSSPELFTRRGFIMLKTRSTLLAFAAALALAGSVSAADSLTGSLTKGTPDLKSAGPLAFGPEGILFIGDTQGAAI